jgi:hypothetical protein
MSGTGGESEVPVGGSAGKSAGVSERCFSDDDGCSEAAASDADATVAGVDDDDGCGGRWSGETRLEVTAAALARISSISDEKESASLLVERERGWRPFMVADRSLDRRTVWESRMTEVGHSRCTCLSLSVSISLVALSRAGCLSSLSGAAPGSI